MFIEAIIIGIVVGLLKGGNFKYFNKLNVFGTTYILIVAIIDLILRFFTANISNSQKLFDIYPYISLLVYIAFIIFLEINRHIKYFRIIETGFILNLLPMILNGGKMPVCENAMIKIGNLRGLVFLKEGSALNHQLISETTRFKILSDIIPIKYIFPKVISVGDILIAISLIMFIVYYMNYGKKLNEKKN